MSRRAATARRAPPAPVEPPSGATVPVRIVVRHIAFCTCGFSRLAHDGAKGDGRCLIPGVDCQAYQEAVDADA